MQANPMTLTRLGLALDRATVRSTDQDGRLHVAVTHISKANVCPYNGDEIPGWQEFGLDPSKVYQMYRDPDELAKGAASFNNVPLLSEHVAVDAQDHRPELVIGSTGTDAAFDGTYLDNSLVVWTHSAIRGIESHAKKEISSAYYYTPDMTPGEVDGVAYDGVMRDIVANHVALVIEGRAGADVVVGDSKKDVIPMPRAKTLSRKAAQVQGALVAYLAPKLAADAKIDLNRPVAAITAKNFGGAKPALLASVTALTKGKLAADADLQDLTDLLDQLDDSEMDESIADEPVEADVENPEAVASLDAATAFLQSKLSPEDFAMYTTLLLPAAAEILDASVDDVIAPAADADKVDEKDKDKVDKAAMDKAITRAVADAKQATMREQSAIRTAERAVKPWVGDLAMSFDSAAGVYRSALKVLGVAGADTIHESALPALLAAQSKPSDRRDTRPTMDAAGAKSFDARFPNASHIRLS